MRRRCVSHASLMPWQCPAPTGCMQVTALAGLPAICPRVASKNTDGNQVATDMPHRGPAAKSATPSLTKAEYDRRKAILSLLKEALAARRISSVLVGRRTIVLRSAQGQERSGGPITLSDPQLYVFAAGCFEGNVVTTDGDAYWFARDSGVPVEDPGYAARAYSWWARSAAD
jgi:hypothetical protein